MIYVGAKSLGKTMEVGAKKGTKLIEYVSEQQLTTSKPSEVDTKVNPLLKNTINGAVCATQASVKVSGFVANRVGKLTKSLETNLGMITFS